MATVQQTTTTTTTNSNTTTNKQQENVITFSQPTLDKANKVRLTIENFYDNLFQEYEEREERYRRLEETMKQQGLSESEVSSLIF
jgi:hypothetical protein